MKKTYLSILIIFCTFFTVAQDSLIIRKNGKFVWGSTLGTYYYLGDISSFSDNPLSNHLSSDMYLGYKITPNFQINLGGSYGKISGNEHNKLIQHNFSTTLFGAGLNAKILGSGWMVKSTSKIVPYFNLGATYFQTKVLSDLKNENGEKYYYWSDGLIRNQPQLQENINTATLLNRDYINETNLADLNVFNPSFIAYKAGFGFDFYINKFITYFVEFNFNKSKSDYLDGLELGKYNDAFFVTNFGLEFNIKGIKNKIDERKDSKKLAKELDLESLLVTDSDEDGVADVNDKCMGTKSGAKVDIVGCPVDTDKDGIPDYMDEQADTPDSMYVNEKGVGLTREEIAKIIPKVTVGINRDEVCKYYPYMCKIEESDFLYLTLNSGLYEKNPQVTSSQLSIEEIIKLVDINIDGEISKEELNNYILLYFKGKTPLKSYDIHLLIEHYFDQ